MAKCWIYNELSDIPDEFVYVEKNDCKKQQFDKDIKSDEMFDDLKRILIRKGWIKDDMHSGRIEN